MGSYGVELICSKCKEPVEIDISVKGVCYVKPCPHCMERSSFIYGRIKQFVDDVEKEKAKLEI